MTHTQSANPTKYNTHADAAGDEKFWKSRAYLNKMRDFHDRNKSAVAWTRDDGYWVYMLDSTDEGMIIHRTPEDAPGITGQWEIWRAQRLSDGSPHPYEFVDDNYRTLNAAKIEAERTLGLELIAEDFYAGA